MRGCSRDKPVENIGDVSGSVTVQLKSAVSQSTPSSIAISPTRTQPALIPLHRLTAQLDLETF